MVHSMGKLKRFLFSGFESDNSMGVTELMHDCERGDLEQVEKLLADGADPHRKDKYGANSLFYAVRGKNPSILKTILDESVEVNVLDIRKRSPLILAARYANETIISLLVQYGARIEGVDEYGKSLINLVLSRGLLNSFKLFLSKGCPLLTGNEETDGLLTYNAVEGKNIELVSLLIQKKAPVNFQDKNLNTPLHISLLQKLNEIAALLIESGAWINAKNRRGETPLMMAQKLQAIEIEKLLIKKGADPELLPGPCRFCGKEFFHGFWANTTKSGSEDFNCSWCGKSTCHECSERYEYCDDEYEKICHECIKRHGIKRSRFSNSFFTTIKKFASRPDNRFVCPECNKKYDLEVAVNTFLKSDKHNTFVCIECSQKKL
ncbi:MAG: ankyrin repeat domain-containing protein [Candidatus Riflebacteria bacterium]|nr:ankyrin repeat domain-containing protein [Candidatus Riflebacteria bacterium]